MRHIEISQFSGEDCSSPFEIKVCEAVYGVLERPFDIDFAVLIPADRREGEQDSYWYEIHAEHNEESPIEPSTPSAEGVEVLDVLRPLFAAIGAIEIDDAVGQEFYLGYNWLRVIDADAVKHDHIALSVDEKSDPSDLKPND